MQKFYPAPKSFRIIMIGFLILSFTGFFEVSQAQVRTIKGVVSASDTKETLPGATVIVKGTATGAVTDIDGKFSIAVNSDKAVLVFSFVGYSTK